MKNQKIFYTNDGLNSVTAVKVEFEPKDISINPENQSLIIASNDTHVSKIGIYQICALKLKN